MQIDKELECTDEQKYLQDMGYRLMNYIKNLSSYTHRFLYIEISSTTEGEDCLYCFQIWMMGGNEEIPPKLEKLLKPLHKEQDSNKRWQYKLLEVYTACKNLDYIKGADANSSFQHSLLERNLDVYLRDRVKSVSEL